MEIHNDIRRYDVLHEDGAWLVVSFDAANTCYFIGEYPDAVKAYGRASHLQRKLRNACAQFYHADVPVA